MQLTVYTANWGFDPGSSAKDKKQKKKSAELKGVIKVVHTSNRKSCCIQSFVVNGVTWS